MTRSPNPALLALLSLAACARNEAPAVPAETHQAVLAIVATCATTVGEVQVRRPGRDEWEPVEPGSVFRVGDEVRTGALATAQIEFAQGGSVELAERSRVTIDLAPPAQGAPAAESRIAVQEGEVRGRLPAPGSKAAAIVVRGSDGGEVRLARGMSDQGGFRVTPSAGGIQLAVMEGDAVLTGAGRGPVTLRAGQLTLVSADGLGDAADLIRFPESLEPGVDAHPGAVGAPVRLAWGVVPGAAGYRVQVASDLSFQRLELVRDLAGQEAVFIPAAAGLHAWRVAARDTAGRYGEYGFARRIFTDEAPVRDLLVAPPDGAVLRLKAGGVRVRFAWSPVAGAEGYRLVVASGPDLQDEVASARVDREAVQLTLADPGELWWGVYAERGGARVPLSATGRRLTLGKPSPPRAEVPSSISRWGE